MKTFKIYTLGCKVNQYDTQVLREKYLGQGYQEVAPEERADLYIINTCTVTAAADKKSRYYINYSRRQNPRARIVVTGCAVNKVPGEIKKVSGFAGHTRAFLKIQDGCDNSCSYCKVHLVRGRSRSKSLNDVIEEAKELAGKGFKEIVLCGVCLGLYGRDLQPQQDLADIIIRMEKISGLERIRLSSLEAWDITAKLIDCLAGSKKICQHLHIPIQSGSDMVLKRMNRKSSFDSYAKLFRKLKKKMPDLAISTDIMVGFPGETDSDFQETLNLLRIAKPLKVHIFPYSLRPGTPGAKMTPLVNPKIVAERVAKLKFTTDKFAANYQKKFLRKTLAVLIENRVKEDPRYWEGHTGNYLKVRVRSGADLSNQLLKLKLKNIKADHFLAEIC